MVLALALCGMHLLPKLDRNFKNQRDQRSKCSRMLSISEPIVLRLTKEPLLLQRVAQMPHHREVERPELEMGNI